MVQLNLMSRLKDISMTQHLIKMKKDKAVHHFDKKKKVGTLLRIIIWSFKNKGGGESWGNDKDVETNEMVKNME